MSEHILDQPEHSELTEPSYAGFIARAFATVIDFLVLIPVWVLMFYNVFNVKSLYLALFVQILPCLYKVFMEGTRGATVGKSAMQIFLVNEHGGKINLQTALVRNLLYILSAILGAIEVYRSYSMGLVQRVETMRDYNQMQSLSGSKASLIVGLIIVVSILFVLINKKRQTLYDKWSRVYAVLRESQP